MSLKDKSLYLKIFAIYLVYNAFLKIFFTLFNHIIYVEYPEEIARVSFFVIRDNLLTAFFESIARIILSDVFWLLPYTVMNIYIFKKLIKYLIEGREHVYEHLSFVILKVYFFWCIIYLLSIGFGSFLEEDNIGSLLGGGLAPYGGYTITYLLLGNFVFLLIFVPLWNSYIKKWIK